MTTSLLLTIWLASLGAFGEPATPVVDTHPPMHPRIKLLDKDGRSVLESKGPVSTLRTCGNCHDTRFITEHSYHAAMGSDHLFKPGHAPSGRPWDTSPGLFGRWDALSNGPTGSNLVLEEWARWASGRHVGGGPAQPIGVEMDCFLCHMPSPDHTARQKELGAGRFQWAATASLSSTGIVKQTAAGWQWDPKGFNEQGECNDAFPRPRATTSENCGLCHGAVHTDSSPFVLKPGPENASAVAKGQVFSAQLLKNSGLNLEGKETLARPFDIHADRLLKCGDCHSTINNPTQFSGIARNALTHLAFEPRRLTPSEYLARPNHHLAKGHTPQGTVARELDGTMRRCEYCHDAESGHEWLPYTRRHLQAINCESCHIPRVFAPAREQTDWTVIGLEGNAATAYRGSTDDPSKPSTLLHGFQPVLLPRQELGGSLKLTPHNLISTWFWVAGDPPVPVTVKQLRQVFLQGNDFQPEVKTLLDADHDGKVSSGELRLDTTAKVEAIRSRLERLGLKQARIQAEIQPYSLHHGVATGTYAVRECAECHSRESRVNASIELARYVPGGILPTLVADANTRCDGQMTIDTSGRLLYQPATAPVPLHVIGLNRWKVGDLIGAVAVTVVLLGVFVHGGLRVRSARKG
ncbi:MAG: hypothetical protein ACP5XB_28395 [Isosphaeraceae bacterium]